MSETDSIRRAFNLARQLRKATGPEPLESATRIEAVFAMAFRLAPPLTDETMGMLKGLTDGLSDIEVARIRDTCRLLLAVLPVPR